MTPTLATTSAIQWQLHKTRLPWVRTWMTMTEGETTRAAFLFNATSSSHIRDLLSTPVNWR